MEQNRIFRCGIVGCGGIAQVHGETLHRLPGVKLAACADIRPERAAAMGEKYGCRAYSSLEEMLEKDQGLMYALLLYVCQRGLKDQLYLNCLNYQTIRERIAYWIVGLHNLSPVESVHMPGSQLILANMLHVSRSSLNQELKLMQKDGYFKVRGREMYELDEEKLNALL